MNRLDKRFALILIGLIWLLAACTMSANGDNTPQSDAGSVNHPAPLDIAATVTPLPTAFKTLVPTITPPFQQSSTPARVATTAPVVVVQQPPATPVYTVSLPAPYPPCSVYPAGAYDVNIRQSASTNSAIVGRLKQASWVQVAGLYNGWYQVSYPGTPVHGGWISSSVAWLTQPCVCGPACVVPAPTPYPTQSTVCTGTVLRTTSLFAGPSRDYAIVTQVAGADVFQVFTRSSNFWYKLNIGAPSLVGWIDGSLISLSSACRPLPIEDPPPPPQQGCSATTRQQATVYEGPGIAYREIVQIAAGATYGAVIRSSNNWYKVGITSPETGWIDGAQLTLAGRCDTLPVQDPPAQTCLATAYTLSDVYTGPGPEYPWVTQIASGTALPVLALSNNRWFKLDLPTFAPGAGVWISETVVTLSGDCRNVPVENPPPAGCTATTIQSVNIYDGPGSAYGVVGTSPAGTVHPVSARSSTYWYKVTPLHFTPPPDFWIEGSALELSANCHALNVEDPSLPNPIPQPQTCVATAIQETQLYSGPGADTDLIATMLLGDSYVVVARSASNWLRFEYSSSPTGAWVDGGFVTLAGACDALPIQ
jgi:uncharacterized protein YgiM (DUF1202 family)